MYSFKPEEGFLCFFISGVFNCCHSLEQQQKEKKKWPEQSHNLLYLNKLG